MKLSFIKYGKRKIKIKYELLHDCYGLYDPNHNTLQLDKRLKPLRLLNTLMHELFHVIMSNENINVDETQMYTWSARPCPEMEKVFPKIII